ncbi:Copper chaperone for superoxide dismutase [Zancudomyces culisetae]|uniref:Copper chaperone for superoxide dismutase n=1 Tax=Zancudomyces culisetae TaxID=1213189 RepID=A0A1R1PWN4_ZANCU|nr:Copper chaperone for superoxide dismutase [Zancudomyces culisetae]|eukprot:OMH85396.1 Copper chaperone for superoxide dismutase [Zancudomyces culisetae]
MPALLYRFSIVFFLHFVFSALTPFLCTDQETFAPSTHFILHEFFFRPWKIRPSLIVEKLHSSGRTAVVRGAGLSNGASLGAAVSILDRYPVDVPMSSGVTSGLVRFIQICEDECYLDVTFNDAVPGKYSLNIHANGDTTNVPKSCGGYFSEIFKKIFNRSDSPYQKDILIDVGQDGKGKTSLECQGWNVHELIGRSVIIDQVMSTRKKTVLAGIIARSSGLFENNKLICACTGNTIWEEDAIFRSKSKF